MEGLIVELTVTLAKNDEKVLPDQTMLIEHLMGYVYQYYDKAGVLVQSVQVTAIEGEQVS